ncbi:MAG: SpvB/TcaC N-terminal domain-containing protein [Byssovorax sp.]
MVDGCSATNAVSAVEDEPRRTVPRSVSKGGAMNHRARGEDLQTKSAAPPASAPSPKPENDTGASTSPAPSLPKGGGAIRGIGETFSASPVTGTGSFRVPIAASPGRSGFHPDLSLAYDSGAGNGPFGHGFHLSVPQISRKTEKGLPRYDDAHGSDVFLLSGAEDLVPYLIEGENGWTRSVTDTGTEMVERYRPRVEGLFARIEKRRNKVTGIVHWVAVTKDNVTSIYGLTEAARIADPADGARVFSWLLEETHDDRGNVIAYDYKAEDLAGVSAALAWEAHRKKAPNPPQNRYLKRIRYGNTTPGDAGTALFEIVFDYGEHDALVPAPDEATLDEAPGRLLHLPRRLRDPHVSPLPPDPDVPPDGRARRDALPRPLHGIHLQ